MKINEESYDFLKNQLRNLGFGDDIAGPLREKMEKGLAEFTLPHERKFGNDEVESTLYFSKGDQKDITFFNKFEATLKQEGKENLTQTFFIGQELKFNYTLQERYNMMDGRAVYREQPRMTETEENGKRKMVPTGETYFAWRALDFRESDGYGNFNPKIMFWDHEKELRKLPIKNIEERYDRQQILRPLTKGNKVEVTILRDNTEVKATVVANPRMMRFDFYDAEGKRLTVRPVVQQSAEQSQKTELTPQDIQRAAIARAAEAKQSPGTEQQERGVRNRRAAKL